MNRRRGLVAALLCPCTAVVFQPAHRQCKPPNRNGTATIRPCRIRRIQAGQHHPGELWQMGFDPFKYPNIKLLNYLDVTRQFFDQRSIHLADWMPKSSSCITQAPCARATK